MLKYINRHVLGIGAAFGSLGASASAFATGTPIAAATTAIGFTDIVTDITAFFVALLGVVLVVIAFRMAFRWLKRAVG